MLLSRKQLTTANTFLSYTLLLIYSMRTNCITVLDLNYLQTFADELGIPFLETSAKDSIKVEQAFLTMAGEIRKK